MFTSGVYLCLTWLIFIIISIFVIINHITSLKQTHLLFHSFFRTSPIIFFSIPTNNKIKTWMKKRNGSQIAKVQPQSVTQLLLNFHKQPPEVFYKKTVLKNFAIFTGKHLYFSRSSRPEVFCKKVFLGISQNSQENTCARVSFLIKLQGGLKLY